MSDINRIILRYCSKDLSCSFLLLLVLLHAHVILCVCVVLLQSIDIFLVFCLLLIYPLTQKLHFEEWSLEESINTVSLRILSIIVMEVAQLKNK